MAGVKQLADILPGSQALTLSAAEEVAIRKIIPIFEAFYTNTIEKIAPIINQLAGQLPKRRERVQHIGLFGYSREVGKVKLPRAIGFTAALYSLGIPPELIGTGRGLAAVTASGQLTVVEKFYRNLRPDLIRAGYYLNKKNLQALIKLEPAWSGVMDDIKAIENYLGITLGPETDDHQKHLRLSSQIFKAWLAEQPATAVIEKAALLRKSMG